MQQQPCLQVTVHLARKDITVYGQASRLLWVELAKKGVATTS